MESLMDWVTEQSEVDEIKAAIDHHRRTVEKEELDLQSAAISLGKTQSAQEILQLLAQAVQQKAHQQIAQVVSSCLTAVFGEDAYEFHIGFERKRGKTEAVLTFKRGELEVDPLTSSGGGAVDVAAFALRVASLVLHRPRLSKIVVLDEAFKFVSSQYRENVRLMLESLSKDMGIQIIQVTHIEELSTGKIIEI